VVNYLDQFRSRLSMVRVDAIGIGHNFGLHLRDCRFPVELVNVAMACEGRSQLGENDPARRFVNQKAQYYQNLADALERDQLDGLSDETTIGQLAGLLYELDGQGRIKIEPKEKARERGVPSPDRADALMLATGRPYRKLEVYTSRDLARLRSQSGITDSYQDEVPESRRRQLQRLLGRPNWPRGGGIW
jgi:hypothetical protein